MLQRAYMSASKKITIHLGKKNVQFEVVPHKKVYTAYDLAQTLGTKLEEIAKTLLVYVELPTLKKKDQRHYVVIVPASYRVDLEKVKKALKATRVSIASEKMMDKLGIKPGALSPFGSLRGLGVVADKALLKTKQLIVGAESFTDSLRMKTKDLFAIEMPVLGAIGKKNSLKLQKKSVKKPQPKRPKKKAIAKKRKK
jgi:prolyl-tRNA editing enzyme YbaK/EbsC (Cys-tRNA(Pro) deacylase)